MQELTSVTDPVDAPPARGLRVCLIIGQLGLGGAENQLVLLATGLHQRGVDVIVLVLTGEGPREATLRAAGVPVVHLGMRRPRGWRALTELLGAQGRLTRYLRQSRPDVVHAFLFHSYVMGAPAARLARVPVFIAGRRSLDDFKRGRRVLLAIERVATRMTDLLVANADAVADCVRRGERVPDGKLTVIYNGLPPSAFASAEPAELDATHPVVLCVANLSDFKGHAHLLDAAALLRDRGLPCTLVLAGEGPQRAALREQADRLGIDVRLLGARTDIGRLLARADVVVLPSLTEGMSNAVMEAMASVRPVVATAVGGTPELLADGRGLLVPPGDPVALADALAVPLVDPQRARRMAGAARDWSLAHLQADVMVRHHLALYQALRER
ncbi:MAG TPA: glycosyltransferase [Rugosimonospora sp.]